jgi:hypothetical protein
MKRIAGMTVVPLPSLEIGINISAITSPNPLVKGFDVDGKKNADGAKIYKAVLNTYRVANLAHLQGFIATLTQNQCLCLGGVHGTHQANITTNDYQHLYPNAITRSKKYIHWMGDLIHDSYSILFFDFDFSDDLPKVLRARTFKEIRALLIKTIPALGHVQMLERWSSSSKIMKADGTLLNDKTSMHIFIVAKNVTESAIKELKEYIYRSLWSNDLAYCMIDKGDKVLQRSFIDMAVLSPERIIITAAPILPIGWYKAKLDEFALYDGGALDLDGIDYSHLPEYLPAFWDAKHALEATIERAPRKSGAYIKREALPASFAIGASLQDKLMNINNELNKGGETISHKQLVGMIDGEVTRYLLQGIGYSIDNNYKFKIREERTASASIRSDGLINDFGGDFGGNIINFLIDICGFSYKTSNKYVRIALGSTSLRLKPSDYEPLIDPKKLKNYSKKDL